MSFSLHIWGDHACFRRPEFVDDFVTYDFITPIAARRVFDAIYSSRSIRWIVESIVVLKPVQRSWVSMKRVEFDGSRRRAEILDRVGYIVTADCVLTDKSKAGEYVEIHADKFLDLAGARRAFRPPFLGLADYPAEFTLLEAGGLAPASDLMGTGRQDFGWMLLEPRGETGPRPVFFRSWLTDGMLDLRDISPNNKAR